MDTILELDKFSDVKYFDGPHKYYIDGIQLTSATKFIGKFKPKFETEKIQFSMKRGLDYKNVISEWDLKETSQQLKDLYCMTTLKIGGIIKNFRIKILKS